MRKSKWFLVNIIDILVFGGFSWLTCSCVVLWSQLRPFRPGMLCWMDIILSDCAISILESSRIHSGNSFHDSVHCSVGTIIFCFHISVEIIHHFSIWGGFCWAFCTSTATNLHQLTFGFLHILCIFSLSLFSIFLFLLIILFITWFSCVGVVWMWLFSADEAISPCVFPLLFLLWRYR